MIDSQVIFPSPLLHFVLSKEPKVMGSDFIRFSEFLKKGFARQVLKEFLVDFLGVERYFSVQLV